MNAVAEGLIVPDHYVFRPPWWFHDSPNGIAVHLARGAACDTYRLGDA